MVDGAAAELLASLRGDCHSHSDWSDGGSPIAEMARAARALGRDYLVLTDHSARLTVAHGLNEERLRAQLDVLAELNDELAPFRVLTGMEVDILEDGSLDLDLDLLGELDVVVASVHSKLKMESAQMTDRMLAAIESPHTDVLGHCTGRLITGRGRPQSAFDAEVVFSACARTGTAVEINCRPERQDPPEDLLRQAVDLGCRFAIDTDAHAPGPARVARPRLSQRGRRRGAFRACGQPGNGRRAPGLGGHTRRGGVTLPVGPPLAPMLAKLSRELPRQPGLFYEPKWDGFRCIVFRDGEEVILGSRNEKPLTRYFPELVEALERELPPRCVMDGEIVIAGAAGLDFDALSQRIHPADKRIRQLAALTPASFVAFDLLAHDDVSLMDAPYAQRRAELESVLAAARPPVYLTPVTGDPDVAADWFARFEGAGLDGVVAKASDLRYLPDTRAMLKVKHQRTADCVVAGFRTHKDGAGVGSLLLGLHDASGSLHHVGVASGFSVARRRDLVAELAPYRADALEGHPWAGWAVAAGRAPGGTNRWNAGKDMSWEPVRPEAVCEVSYDHLQGDRFRHATSFVRWRPEREPASCTYAQLETPVPMELSEVFGAPTS